MLKDGTIHMVYSNKFASLFELHLANSAVRDFLGEEMQLSHFPPITGGEIGIPQATNFIGIRANCNKPQVAFNFIKIVLSDDFQKTIEENIDNSYYSSSVNGAAVNENVFLMDEQYYVSEDVNSHGEKRLRDSFEGFDDFNDTYSFAGYNMSKNLKPTFTSIVVGPILYVKMLLDCPNLSREIDSCLTLF